MSSLRDWMRKAADIGIRTSQREAHGDLCTSGELWIWSSLTCASRFRLSGTWTSLFLLLAIDDDRRDDNVWGVRIVPDKLFEVIVVHSDVVCAATVDKPDERPFDFQDQKPVGIGLGTLGDLLERCRFISFIGIGFDLMAA